MSTDRTIQLTADGKARLEAELLNLRDTRLPNLTARVQDVNESGDAADNSEYDDIKEDIVQTEARIRELEHTLENAEIVAEGSPDGTIGVGSHVTVRSDDGEEETWVLVSAEEASAPDGRLSDDSPVGHALRGLKAGDSAPVETPGGTITYEVIAVK